MANGLNLSNLLGQSSNAGGLLGGGIFSQPETRGARRSRLLTEAISGAGQNPYARLGASFGGLIGMGGRAAGESLGILDKPEEVQRNEALRKAQQAASEAGVDPVSDPNRFYETIQPFLSDFPDLNAKARLQVAQIQKQLTPEAKERRITVTGGSPEAEQLRQQTGYTVPEGKTFALGVEGSRITSEKDLTGDPDEPTRVETEIQTYLNRGYSLQDAQDIAYGNVRPVTDPLTGNTELVNVVTTQSRPVSVQPSQPQSSSPTPETKDVESPATTEEEQGILDRELEVGLVPWLQEGISRTFGQFFDSANNPSVTRARSQLRQAKQQLISALSVSGRPPVIEQQRIEQNLPSLGPAESPERARVQLETLLGDLERQKLADQQSINNENLNPQLRKDLQQRVDSVNKMIRLVDPSRLQEGQEPSGEDRASEATISVREAQSALPDNSILGNWNPEEEGWEVRRGGEVIGYIK